MQSPHLWLIGSFWSTKALIYSLRSCGYSCRTAGKGSCSSCCVHFTSNSHCADSVGEPLELHLNDRWQNTALCYKCNAINTACVIIWRYFQRVLFVIFYFKEKNSDCIFTLLKMINFNIPLGSPIQLLWSYGNVWRWMVPGYHGPEGYHVHANLI